MLALPLLCPHSLAEGMPSWRLSHTFIPQALRCPPQVRPCPDACGSEKSETVAALEKVTMSGGKATASVFGSLGRGWLQKCGLGVAGGAQGGKALSRMGNGEEAWEKDQPVQRHRGWAWGPQHQLGSWTAPPGSHLRCWSGAGTIMAHFRCSLSNSTGKVTHPNAGPCVGNRCHCCHLQRGPPGFGNSSHMKI